MNVSHFNKRARDVAVLGLIGLAGGIAAVLSLSIHSYASGPV
jgi:hypothetical protein